MKSVLKAGGTRLLTFPLTAIATLLTARLIIAEAGPESYGLVMLIASLFLFLPFADLGTGTAVVNALSDPSVPRARAVQTISQILRWLLRSSALIALVAVGGGFLHLWSLFLGASPKSAASVDLAATVSLLVFALSVPFSVGQRIFVGLGRADRSILISSLSSVMTLAAAFLLSTVPADPLLYAATIPVGILFTQVMQFVFASRLLGVPLSMWKRAEEKSVSSAQILRQAAPMLVILVAAPVMLQGHRVLLGHLGTYQELAEYSLAMQLYTPLWGFISSGAAALWPMFGNRRGNQTAVRGLFLQALALFSGLGLAAGIGLVAFGPVLGRMVSGGQVHLSGILLLSFGALAMAQSVQQVPGMLLTTPRGLAYQAAMVSLAAVASVVLSYFFIRTWGPSGPGFATAVSLIVFMLIPSLVLVGKPEAYERTLPQE